MKPAAQWQAELAGETSLKSIRLKASTLRHAAKLWRMYNDGCDCPISLRLDAEANSLIADAIRGAADKH